MAKCAGQVQNSVIGNTGAAEMAPFDNHDNTDRDTFDMMRQMCIDQGYVPKGCNLVGAVVYALVSEGEDPCSGCNMNRSVCGGRQRKDAMR